MQNRFMNLLENTARTTIVGLGTYKLILEGSEECLLLGAAAGAYGLTLFLPYYVNCLENIFNWKEYQDSKTVPNAPSDFSSISGLEKYKKAIQKYEIAGYLIMSASAIHSLEKLLGQ